MIVPKSMHRAAQGFREFVVEFQDSQLAYQAGSVAKLSPYTPYSGVTVPTTYTGWRDPPNAIVPPNGGPSIITGGEPGSRTLNYRNEPIPHCVAVPPKPDPGADKSATDMAHVFRSIERSDPAMNKQPAGPIAPASPFNFPEIFTDAQPFDPFTPFLRAYENDRVQIRVLVGAHHEPLYAGGWATG
jgi:manganese oxidase